jgi:hypothetical protein
MSDGEGQNWMDLAREHRIDPDEVRLVFDRYDAQRRFYAQGRAEPMGLDQWFQFYRMEKASEGQQSGPVPSGCSVDSGAVNDACIEKPAEFLQVLRAYRHDPGDG